MEMSFYKGVKYSTKCPDCYGAIKFTINTNNFNISGECLNNHKLIDMSTMEFQKTCIQKTNSSYVKCNRCYYLIHNQSNNFLCENCNQIFCNNCINIHSKEKQHIIRSNYISNNKRCKLHNSQYTSFCENCKINLCDKCKENHILPNHIIKSFTDILPSNKDIESIKEISNKYDEKINKIMKEIEKCKENILERYKKIIDFLSFLSSHINDKLIKQFNFSFFDYYNYENFKYCINFLNKDEIFQNNNYINYLINGKHTYENKSDNNSNKEKIDKIIMENKELYDIKYHYNLIYYKDNLFLDIGNLKSINLFEFKKHSFEAIAEYKLRDLGDINTIKIAKYNKDILINFDKKKNIKVLEYNIEEKKFSLMKNEVKAKKYFYDRYFYDCIEDKNNCIITSDFNGICLWKKHKKKIYVNLNIINGNYSNLFNVTENIFCAKSKSKDINITFFKENLQLLATVDINSPFTYIGVLEDKYLCINNENDNNLMLIDLKYFEIAQIISNEKRFDAIHIKENYLYQFYIEDSILKINKKYFEYKKGYFEEKQLIEKTINYTTTDILDYSFFQILFTDNDYLIVTNSSELYAFNYN